MAMDMDMDTTPSFDLFPNLNPTEHITFYIPLAFDRLFGSQSMHTKEFVAVSDILMMTDAEEEEEEEEDEKEEKTLDTSL